MTEKITPIRNESLVTFSDHVSKFIKNESSSIYEEIGADVTVNNQSIEGKKIRMIINKNYPRGIKQNTSPQELQIICDQINRHYPQAHASVDMSTQNTDEITNSLGQVVEGGVTTTCSIVITANI